MKNPKWNRDELILTLDLYFQLEPGQIHNRNPKVIELSKILNELPIHKDTDRNLKFRNPNGVGLKLSNFLSIDPNYKGKGMERFSKLDEEIFWEFVDKKEELKRLAIKIKEIATKKNMVNKLYRIPDEEDDGLLQVKEGRVMYKLHKVIERDKRIVKKKKEFELEKKGKLQCEVCNFDFKEFYGEIGEGFIECHHIEPISTKDFDKPTKLEDLAIVCSNCHRMLHKKLDTLSIEELKKIIKKVHDE